MQEPGSAASYLEERALIAALAVHRRYIGAIRRTVPRGCRRTRIVLGDGRLCNHDRFTTSHLAGDMAFGRNAHATDNVRAGPVVDGRTVGVIPVARLVEVFAGRRVREAILEGSTGKGGRRFVVVILIVPVRSAGTILENVVADGISGAREANEDVRVNGT